MESMRELVDEASIRRVLLVLAWTGPPVGLVLGAAWGAWRRRPAQGWRKGLFLGLTGPLIGGMWVLHSYLTRYDPRTDYFGLERVDVFLLNLLLFALLGAGLGWLWARLFATAPSEVGTVGRDQAPPAVHGDDVRGR